MRPEPSAAPVAASVVESPLQDKLGPCVSLGRVFMPTAERAQRAYRLNKCFGSLRHEASRERFAQDAEAYLREHGLNATELAMVANRAYIELLNYGVATVALAKLCRMHGVNLVQLGAGGMGLAPEAFMAQRKEANKGYPWEF